jgi:hypothetical protein
MAQAEARLRALSCAQAENVAAASAAASAIRLIGRSLWRPQSNAAPRKKQRPLDAAFMLFGY